MSITTRLHISATDRTMLIAIIGDAPMDAAHAAVLKDRFADLARLIDGAMADAAADPAYGDVGEHILRAAHLAADVGYDVA